LIVYYAEQGGSSLDLRMIEVAGTKLLSNSVIIHGILSSSNAKDEQQTNRVLCFTADVDCNCQNSGEKNTQVNVRQFDFT